MEQETTLKWLEIIEFNYLDSTSVMIEENIEDLVEKLKNGHNNQIINIYSRVADKIDFRIHVHHKSNRINKDGSILGKGLSSILTKYGRVEHSIWV